MNNFGIVTKLTAKTYPQTKIQVCVAIQHYSAYTDEGLKGSFLTVAEDKIQSFAEAIVKYTNTVKDPKASLNPLFSYANDQVSNSDLFSLQK
jgi:hypothetical protein